LGGLDWACATAAHEEYSPDVDGDGSPDYDLTVDARKAALQLVTASLQDAVDNEREARLEMGDVYVYAQVETMLKVTTGRRRVGHKGCKPNSAGFGLGQHCAEYTLEEDGVDGELFMPDFHSPALRIHRDYGVCDTFNLNAIGSNLTLPIGDSLFIRGYVDPENTVSAYQLEDKYLSAGVRIFVHGAERHFDNVVEVSGGESVKVLVRRGTQSREKNPFAPYCVDKVRGEDVKSRSSCRESCLRDLLAVTCEANSNIMIGDDWKYDIFGVLDPAYTPGLFECGDHRNFTSCVAAVACAARWTRTLHFERRSPHSPLTLPTQIPNTISPSTAGRAGR
jgi:hypothetical protein